MADRTMTWKTLMKKIDDGYAEVNAWGLSTTWDRTGGTSYADVTFFKSDGTSKRECITLTRIPVEQQR